MQLLFVELSYKNCLLALNSLNLRNLVSNVYKFNFYKNLSNLITYICLKTENIFVKYFSNFYYAIFNGWMVRQTFIISPKPL